MDSLTANPLAKNQANATKEIAMSPAPKNPTAFEALAQELFSSSDSSPKRLGEIISRDVALKAQVISLANALIYSFGRPVKSLSQAIACLGYSRCRELIAIRLGVQCGDQTQPDQSADMKPPEEVSQRLPGVRPYGKKRLSSLYPPKNRSLRPHFLSGEQGQT